jgi:hypothetical protein
VGTPQPPGTQAAGPQAPGAQPSGTPPPAYGYPPPPPGQPYAAPGQPYPPPPGYGYPPPGQGYPPPPGAAPPGYPQPPPWGYPQPPVPDNGAAIAGFVFALVAGGLLFMSAGLSSIVSIACAIVGIVYSRKGKQKVDAGETPKHRSLAQAGFIIGWVSLGLSILATLAWLAILIVGISSDSSNGDFETIRAAVRLIGG